MSPAKVNIDISNLQAPIIQGPDLISVLVGLISWFLVLAGIAAFLFVLYGGFIYLSAGGDTAATGKAKSTIVNAVIGIVIIFVSYALVNWVIVSLKVVQDSEIETIDERFPAPEAE